MNETTRTQGAASWPGTAGPRLTAWPTELPGCAARCAAAPAWPTRATRWPSPSSNCCPR